MAIAVGLVAIADAQATEYRSEVDADRTYVLRHVAPLERELVIWERAQGAMSAGREIMRYRLRECGLGSSETGAFLFLDEVNTAPTVVVLCQTPRSLRSLYVFAPAISDAAPAFAIEEKLSLGVLVSQALLVAGWRDPENPDEFRTETWKPDRDSIGSERYREARDAAIGKRIARYGLLPEGLTSGDYVMARDPDTPMRLGPSANAPWFRRLNDHLLIHLEDTDEAAVPFWKIGDWLRVCVVDGGCGYVTVDDLVRLQ